MSNTDTPRTNYAAGWVLDATPELEQGFVLCTDGSYVNVDFARTLERELNKQHDRADQLAAKVIELEAELEKRHKEYSKALNKRVDVEAQLIDIGAGKRDLPTKEECMAWALKLGNS